MSLEARSVLKKSFNAYPRHMVTGLIAAEAGVFGTERLTIIGFNRPGL